MARGQLEAILWKIFIFLKDFTPINVMAVDNVICFTLNALLFCVLSDLTIV